MVASHASVLLVNKYEICNDDGSHSFHDGQYPWCYAAVVAVVAGDGGGFSVKGDGLLFALQGGDGFEGDTEDNVLAVGDAGLHAAVVVAVEREIGVLRVIVLRTAHTGGGKTFAHLEALGGIDG